MPRRYKTFVFESETAATGTTQTVKTVIPDVGAGNCQKKGDSDAV